MTLNDLFIRQIARELQIGERQVEATAKLLAEGGTVPFIARYRKEVTGSLDEVAILNIRDRLLQLVELEARRHSILNSLKERNLLTTELEAAIAAAESMARLEDIYQPFRPKRRTRAMIAREKGLEPLAQWLLQHQDEEYQNQAAGFVDSAKEVASVAEALAGARDILAEQFSDDADLRTAMRRLYEEQGILESKVMPGKEEEAAKYRDYFDWKEPVAKAPSHRILAIRRGSQEGFLYFSISPQESLAIEMMEKAFLRGSGGAGRQVKEAIAESYKRLLGPSMETEVRVSTKKRADEEAIRVFADNVRELLLASPLGQKRVLALDPGLRTGCKLVCLDEQGMLIHDDVIYPSQGVSRMEEARHKMLAYCQRFEIAAIAIGNGTGGRETEKFVRSLGLPSSIIILVVSESGASVYSASDVAREEFPDKDLTVRGAVSIGRRLMDPLAELVKIDPKSIGVGQYQHDVDQRKLKESLDDVVVSCVNGVGVEVNTASKQLLSYVAGLNSRIAQNIIEWRNSKGAFSSRRELLEVSGLGPKAFEQSAGFLRIRKGRHPLDASAVHPEAYPVVEKMAADLGVDVPTLLREAPLRQRIQPEAYVSERFGLPTLKDILEELDKPGRDPRQQFEQFQFNEEVHRPEDLKVGMKLPGIVTNVAAFGAFVDVGVHQDGLVHISQLADNFVAHPSEVVKVQQQVTVTVIEVDLARKRIALSMKRNPDFGSGNSDRKGPSATRAHNGAQRGKKGTSGGAGFGGNWFEDALRSKR